MSLVWGPLALAVVRKALQVLGAPDDDLVGAALDTGWTQLADRASSRSERKASSVDAVVKRQVAQFKLCVPESEKLPDGEIGQAVECVIEHLSELDVSYQELESHDFNAGIVADAGLARLRGRIAARYLSTDAGYLAESLCRLATQQFVAIVANTPEFNRRLTVDTYLAARDAGPRLLESLDEVFLPSVRYGNMREHSQFAASYLGDLVRNHNRVELFGLDDVPPALRRAPLDLAYVNLSAVAGKHSRRTTGPGTASDAFGSRVTVEDLLGDELRTAEAKNHGMRLTLIGTAGSGKTTVTKWIASTIAVSAHSPGRLPTQLSALRGKIPFLVPLRSVVVSDRRLALDDLLAGSGVPAAAPGGWVETLLEDGRACVIFDGLDELPEGRRRRASEWIAGVCRAYRETDVVVTTRPEALDEELVADCQFNVVTLRHMDLDQSLLVIDQWFDAQCSTVGAELASVYRDRQANLRTRILDDQNLQNLADTPLLAAMLCAYYASTSGEGLRDQRRLVNGVLAALLDGRERSRGLLPDEMRSVHLDHKLELLGEIARVLFLEGSNLITVSPEHRGLLSLEVAVADNEIVLPDTMGGVPSAAILDYLLKRSAIVSRVASSEAQFAHRMFLEFLAAHRFVNQGAGTELLAAHGQPGWFTVVPNYCWIAPMHEKVKILDALLLTKGHGRRLAYCLADCLSLVSSVNRETREAIVTRLKASLPPSTEEEVALLASLGGAALEMLAEPQSSDEAAAAILTAHRVRSTDALDLIEGVAQGPFGRTCSDLLVGTWAAFNPEQYAIRVLNRLDLSSVILDIPTAAAAEAVRHIDRVQSFRLSRCDGLDDLQWLTKVRRCVRLDLAETASLSDISALSGHPELRELRLSAAGGIRDLGVLRSLPKLRALFIENGSQLKSLEELRALPSLRVLRLLRINARIAERGVSALSELTSLEIDPLNSTDAAFVSGLKDLERLTVSNVGAGASLNFTDHRRLRRLVIKVCRAPGSEAPSKGPTTVSLPSVGDGADSALRVLVIEAKDHTSVSLTGLPQQAALSEVALLGDVWPKAPPGRTSPWNFHYLQESAKTLRLLTISGSPRLDSLAGVQRLTNLEKLDLSASRISALSGYDVSSAFSVRGTAEDGGEEIQTWHDQRTLRERLSREELRSTRWCVSQCPSLVELILDFCSELVDVSLAGRFQRLETLSMRGSYWESTIEDLRYSLDARVRFVFDETVFHQETG